ncbi:Putative HTH-type transcriptional regulator [Streptomyces sp. YIM 121038]|nr:Putative HTH-type transcriptional regulator [Streptomyces sp. YIM 121038]
MAVEQSRVGNLPAVRTRLVGRQGELAEIARLFAGPSRLVTLTGVGGVGKTRLALEAAARLQPRFRDGVWLVELSALGEGKSLPFAIAEALPLVDQSTRPMIDVLAEYLADREALLVLDTCEHLTEACSLAVQALVRAAPAVRVLTTSRRLLGAPGEEVFTVEPLPVPESGDPAAARADAVVLLAERAAVRIPGLARSEAERSGFIRLARRLEGLPLAIELAAARLGEMSVEELTHALDDRFAVLGDTDEVVYEADPPWHQALRTAIGWSHQLCTPAERLLWARISVFAGTFDVEAAQQVCTDTRLAAERVPGLLAALVDKSILVPQLAAGRGARYRMLDTLREYGAGWLRGLGEEVELRCRHRIHYRALALAADAAWMGPDQAAWYERASADYANFRTALDFCLGEGEDPRTALELAGALWFFWLGCGFLREGRHYLDRALRLGPVAGPVQSKAVWACGAVALGQADCDAAARLAAVFRSHAETAGDPAMLCAAAHLEGGRLVLTGRPAEAATVLDVAPYTEDHDGGYTGARFLAWAVRVFAHTNLGEFARACAVADALRAACDERGERWARAFADYVHGQAAYGLGRLDEAAAHARTALEGKALLHDSIGIGTAIDLLACLAATTGHGERAARLLGIGQQTWNTIGRAQLGIPELIAAREACERGARAGAGDAAYEAAFHRGLADSSSDGLAYALRHDAP